MQKYFSLGDDGVARNIGEVRLHIDCQRMAPSAIDELFEILCRFFGDIVLAGGDLILARGKIHWREYASVWRILRRYDVTVD